jgi:hypothetical protein
MTIEALNFFFGGRAVRAVSSRASGLAQPQDNNGAGFAGAAAAAAASASASSSSSSSSSSEVVDEHPLGKESSPAPAAVSSKGKEKMVDDNQREADVAEVKPLRGSDSSGRKRLLIVVQGTRDDIQPHIALGTVQWSACHV